MTDREANAAPAPAPESPARARAPGAGPRRLPWPVRVVLIAALGAVVAAVASYALRSIGF